MHSSLKPGVDSAEQGYWLLGWLLSGNDVDFRFGETDETWEQGIGTEVGRGGTFLVGPQVRQHRLRWVVHSYSLSSLLRCEEGL